jgi:quercetin dioxygenase-like cupin family protein
MSDDPDAAEAVSLPAVQAELLARARAGDAGRAARTLYGDQGTLLRQTLLALVSGAELAAHEAPPEATLHVLDGRVRLSTVDRDWVLAAGELVAIPPERHGVTALEDSCFLLTVRRSADDASEPAGVRR